MGGALAVGGALMVQPRVAFAGGRGESVFEMRLPRGARASAAGGTWTSAVVRAPKPFELLGIEWSGGRDPGIQVRAQADGRWSEWLDAPLHHGHGPDRNPNGRRRLTDPVWTGRAQLFQLRASAALTAARVVFVDSGAGAAHASALRLVETGLSAGPGQPRIIARSSWATAACRPRVAPVPGVVELVFVHHTASSNYYRPSQSPALIRSICLFHKYGNGWNDIGYNFVVDSYGQIFEARAGGVDEPVVGAQAGGYNVYSSGIALLGSFSGRAPGRQAFESLARLSAWKLSLHGVALPGDVTVEVTRTGAPYSRYRAGAQVRLNRISGHRDADTTTCPGGALYRQLPRLRQRVRDLAPNVGSLAAQATPAAPGIASVIGVLTSNGAPIAGAGVELQQRTAQGLKTVGVATTAPDGSWTATGSVATNASMRVVYRGDADHPAVVSPPVDVTVAPQISLAAAAPQTPPGGVLDFTGAVNPAKAKLSIVVSQQQPDGTFAPIRTIKLEPGRDGTFARTIGFAAAGQYQVVAQTDADDSNAAGASAPVAVTAA